MAAVSIDAQITAVATVLVNEKGHLDVLSGLVAKGKRPPHDPELIEARLPALRAALATLRWVKAHEKDMLERIGAPAAAPDQTEVA
jgi:hypothetical protein